MPARLRVVAFRVKVHQSHACQQYVAGLREPDIQPARRDLWDFRWEHAPARLAGDQRRLYPYLTGYVAFYGCDYQAALAELQRHAYARPLAKQKLG
jgi:hypothetical protein